MQHSLAPFFARFFGAFCGPVTQNRESYKLLLFSRLQTFQSLVAQNLQAGQ
jgi:hypothetical protein